MDEESNYDSDISEGWCLFDINSKLVKTSCKRPIKNEKIEDFCSLNKELDQPQVSESCNSDSFEEVGKSEGKNIEWEKSKTDSCDADSIEILDLDGNDEDSDYRVEVHQLDSVHFNTYQSDDEESLEEFDCKNRNCSTVIKRRKRRSRKNSDDTFLSVNSESKISVKSNLKSPDEKVESERLGNLPEDHHVYKHYRNNVANTVLNLSVGVIFAGVACIAIGHFLGVQDAAETAVELAETLKKLQVENAALQARLFHLNRALIARESNANLKISLGTSKIVPNETVQEKPEKKLDLNKAALSEIRSSLNSIEWLSKLQNVAQKGTEAGSDLKTLETELRSLCGNGKRGGLELLKDSDRKISKILTKVINRLSSSQDNIERLYVKLTKLNEKIDKEEEKKTNALTYPQPEKFYVSIKTNTSETEGKKKNKDEKERKKDKRKKEKRKRHGNEEARKATQRGKKGKIEKSTKKRKVESLNGTTDWIFKWANGREEQRRYEALGDWFFERAKSRRKRKEDDWMLERSKFRKALREGEQKENWQFKRASGRQNSREEGAKGAKKAKYNGKIFFHQSFSRM